MMRCGAEGPIGQLCRLHDDHHGQHSDGVTAWFSNFALTPRVALGILDQIENYVRTIETLRQGAADPQRDAYTVALGQLVAKGLITEDRYRSALALPRNRRPNA